MSKFILISVCDRSIYTETFDSYNEAKAEMQNEMINTGVPEEVFQQYDEYEEDGDYAFGKYGGYSNARYEHDWLIVEIPLKQEEV